MSRIRSRSRAEKDLHKFLRLVGIPFKPWASVPLPGGGQASVDAVSAGPTAFFYDSCFFHGCPLHGNVPLRNRAAWKAKFRYNAWRDLEVSKGLRSAGFRVVRVWGHSLRGVFDG